MAELKFLLFKGPIVVLVISISGVVVLSSFREYIIVIEMGISFLTRKDCMQWWDGGMMEWDRGVGILYLLIMKQWLICMMLL